MNRMCLLAAGVMLSSCTLTPDFALPRLDLPESFPLAQEGKKTSAPVTDEAPTGWKDFFLSDDLRGLIEAALAQNADLRIAALNVQAARAAARETRADLFPSIDAQTGFSRQKFTREQNQNGNNNRAGEYINAQYNAQFVSAFEIDVFGRLQSLNEAAQQEYLASRHARDAVRIALIAEVANAYLQWAADSDLLGLSKKTLVAQRKTYALIQARLAEGIASELDLARARTALESARANRALYARLAVQDKNALRLLLNGDEAALPPAPAPLAEVKLRDAPPVGMPSRVLLARPDVRQAEHRLRAANARIGVARAAFFPRLNLTGAFGYASGDLAHLFSDGAAGAWSFAPRITAPLFEGGGAFATRDVIEARKQIAVAEYERTVQQGFREVSDALAATRFTREQAQAQARLRQAARRAQTLSDARYRAGLDPYLSALEAQRDDVAAQQASVIAERDMRGATIALYRALGGGLR